MAWGLPSPPGSNEENVAVSRAAFGGDLGASKTVVPGVPGASQIVLAGGGAAVLRSGARVFVAPAGSSTFGPPQDLGGVQEDHLLEPDASLLATLTGEVIASVMHTEGDESTAVLPAGSGSFGDSQQYPSLNPNAGQPVPMASDPQGNAFLADFAGNCSGQNEQSVALAARAPAGRFRLSTALRCQSISTANPFPVIGTGGNGGLALLTLTGTPGHYALVLQTRYRGQWSSPHLLARTRPTGSCHSRHWCPTRLIQTLGPPIVNLGGGVTIGWSTCDADGRNCTASAAQGSLRSATWHTRTFTPGLGMQVGNRYAALSQCTKARCQISVSLSTATAASATPAPSPATANGPFPTG